jgi:putative membrane protein
MPVNTTEKLDVDTRFLLANERTLLAWIRTSIAVEAGGIALTQLHKQHSLIGTITMLLGAVVALIGYHRFRAADRAIRSGNLPPVGTGPAIQVFTVVIIAVVLAVAQFTFLK